MTCDISSDEDLGVVDGGAGDVGDASYVLPVPVNINIVNILMLKILIKFKPVHKLTLVALVIQSNVEKNDLRR